MPMIAPIGLAVSPIAPVDGLSPAESTGPSGDARASPAASLRNRFPLALTEFATRSHRSRDQDRDTAGCPRRTRPVVKRGAGEREAEIGPEPAVADRPRDRLGRPAVSWGGGDEEMGMACGAGGVEAAVGDGEPDGEPEARRPTRRARRCDGDAIAIGPRLSGTPRSRTRREARELSAASRRRDCPPATARAPPGGGASDGAPSTRFVGFPTRAPDRVRLVAFFWDSHVPRCALTSRVTGNRRGRQRSLPRSREHVLAWWDRTVAQNARRETVAPLAVHKPARAVEGHRSRSRVEIETVRSDASPVTTRVTR